MRTYLRIIILLIALTLPGDALAAGETPEDFYRQWVDYRDGEISLAFERIPIQFALYALHAKTGFQLVIPADTAGKVVNLKLERQPFEPAMRHLISTIGYRNFALIYDAEGRPNRAVVLGTQTHTETARAAKSDPTTAPLSAGERERLQKDLARWSELGREERGRIEDRLKNLPPSDEREQLVKEYGQQLLEAAK